MVDKHNQSFFGQATGLSIRSSSWEDPYIFINCIKKKPDNSWEKPSRGEGKTIRINLEEIVMILQVLNQKIDKWSSYHTYKDKNTQIAFSWENGSGEKLWINIGKYSKMLTFSQIEILRLLLEHLLEEKIANATVSNYDENQENSNNTYSNKEIEQPPSNNNVKNLHHFNKREQFYRNDNNLGEKQEEFIIKEEIVKPKKKVSLINGILKSETEKAVLISLNPDQEIWFPKSTIHSQFNPDKKITQSFEIDEWILKKNHVF